MTEERKQELRQLLEEAVESLEVRSHLEDVALLCCSMRARGLRPYEVVGSHLQEGRIPDENHDDIPYAFRSVFTERPRYHSGIQR